MTKETVDNLIEQLKNIRIQETEVLEQLCRARQVEKEDAEEHKDTATPKLKKGDLVTITNNITTPVGRNGNEGDRNSTVLHTKIQTNKAIRIYIRTDNGFTTWRLEKNLRRI